MIEPKEYDSDKILPALEDASFKALFQHPKFRRSLSLILSECTHYSKTYIYKNLKFINSELSKETLEEKGNRTDLLIDLDGNIINLEANRRNSPGLRFKNQLYEHKIATKVYSEVYEKALKQGKVETKDIYQVNFDKRNEYDRLIITFIMRDEKNEYTSEDNYKRVHINLSKASEKYYNKEELTRLEKILVMLVLESKKELQALSKGDEELMGIEKIIEALNDDGGNPYAYNGKKMDEAIYEYDMECAKKEGLKQGLEQGSKEKAIAIAKNLLSSGMKKSEIAKIMELSEEELNTII